jgi:hypothetical protein
MSNAAEYLGAIGLDRHAPAAPVPALTTAELDGDLVDVDRQSCRHSIEDRDERLTVRLAGGQKSQHWGFILAEKNAPSGQVPLR